MKSVAVYKLTKDINVTDEALGEFLFSPCGDYDLRKMGFSPTFDGTLVTEVNDKVIFNVSVSEKKPKKSEINRRVSVLKSEYFEEYGKKAGKKTIDSFVEEITMDLLPLTFAEETKHFTIFVQGEFLYVEAASWSKAEDFTALLRTALGSLAILPLAFKNPVHEQMARMIEKEVSETIVLGNRATLLTSEERKWSEIGTLYQSEAQSLIRAGAEVKSLEMIHDGVLTFTLKDDQMITGIKYYSGMFDDFEEGDVTGTVLLKLEEVSKGVNELIREFGGLEA